MRLGGMQPFSLLDYPGQMAAIVFTVGCAFRCPYCHNPELVASLKHNKPLAETVFFDFLKSRQGRLTGVVVTGGEPTIHHDLPEFLGKIKALGFKVKLDSAGVKPAMLETILTNRLADYVAMDIKAPLDKYPLVAGVPTDTAKIRQSIALIKTMAPDYEFRTTLVEGQLMPEDVLAIGELIRGAKRYALQAFVPSKTLNEKYLIRRAFDKETLEQLQIRLHDYVDECLLRA